jgi:hypothetical protein
MLCSSFFLLSSEICTLKTPGWVGFYSDSATDWRILGSNSDWCKRFFFLLQNAQTDSGVPSAHLLMCTDGKAAGAWSWRPIRMLRMSGAIPLFFFIETVYGPHFDILASYFNRDWRNRKLQLMIIFFVFVILVVHYLVIKLLLCVMSVPRPCWQLSVYRATFFRQCRRMCIHNWWVVDHDCCACSISALVPVRQDHVSRCMTRRHVWTMVCAWPRQQKREREHRPMHTVFTCFATSAKSLPL